MSKHALIAEATGQDGFPLARLLLAQNNKIYERVLRRSSDHMCRRLDALDIISNVRIIDVDLTDQAWQNLARKDSATSPLGRMLKLDLPIMITMTVDADMRRVSKE